MNLTELERLEREATPGPWDHYGGVLARRNVRGDDIAVAFTGRFVTGSDFSDLNLISAARNALPQLIRIARAAKVLCDGGRGIACWNECWPEFESALEGVEL